MSPMAAKWEKEKQWSDRFLPEIKRILGEHLIEEPLVEEDRERNTDLTVLRLQAIRIGCRVRRHKWLKDCGDQFTIREGVNSGHKTELAKIIEGWGDYFFYGICDKEEEHLARWFILSLNAFRLWYGRRVQAMPANHAPGFPMKNKGNTDSWFRVFNVYAIEPPEAFIEQYGELEYPMLRTGG